MKIGIAFVRKQADAYRSQGFYKEAHKLYNDLLARSDRIDPEIRSAIRRQLLIIKSEMNGTAYRSAIEEERVMPADRDSPHQKRSALSLAAVSWAKTIAAFALVGGILLYGVLWFTDEQEQTDSTAAPKVAVVVVNKIPIPADSGDPPASADESNPDTPAAPAVQEAAGGDSLTMDDPVQAQFVTKMFLPLPAGSEARKASPQDDARADAARHFAIPATEQPENGPAPDGLDPAAAIDYVFKKRGL